MCIALKISGSSYYAFISRKSDFLRKDQRLENNRTKIVKAMTGINNLSDIQIIINILERR
jgi:hypothetical protein